MLTPSDLVLLAAPRFVDAPRRFRTLYDLPDGTSVEAAPLAEAALAAAFLTLESDGHLRLLREPKKEWLGLKSTHTVRAERGAGTPPADTLEASLLAAVGDRRDEVDEVLYRWFGEDVFQPSVTVLDRVRDGLVARGHITRTETKVRKLLWTTTTVAYGVPDATRGALDVAHVAAVQARLVDADGRPDLRDTLRTEIEQGLARRTDHGDAGDID